MDKEALDLAQSLGLSESELLLNFGDSGISPPPEKSALNSLIEMFPHVPRPDVQTALNDSHGSIERATEHLLSWDALQSDVRAVDEIGARKLTKAAKLARKDRQRRLRDSAAETEAVAAIADILGLAEPEARQLYLDNNYSVTDAVLVKCTVTKTAIPSVQQQQMAASIPSRNEYSGKSPRELASRLASIDSQLSVVKEKARKYGTNPLTQPISADAYRDLRELVADRRDVERALNRETFFRDRVRNPKRIDLHGLTLETAQAVSREIVQAFETSDMTTMEIITGAGRHSINGQSVIKDWLRGYLKTKRVLSEEQEGSFVLRKRLL